MSRAAAYAPPQGKPFLHNVLWGWLGIVFVVASGILLSPYVIHHLGDERYGLWAVVFSFVDYYALVDFGFKSAVLKYAAQYRVTGESHRLDALVGTGLLYFSLAAAVIWIAVLAVAPYVGHFFRVLSRDESDFRFLFIAVGVSCSFSIVFGVYTAVLEAYQRFDLSSRIWIANTAIRMLGCFLALCLGGGLKSMGVCVVAGHSVGAFLTWRAVRRLLPGSTFSPRNASTAVLRQMFGYGSRTFMANMSLNVLNQNAPVIIGHFLSATMAGYYLFAMRLLSYAVEFVDRLATITVSKAAELNAHDDMKSLSRMAVVANRYAVLLFLPLAVYLVLFGRQLLQVWINPSFAANSASLLPVLAAGVVIAIAAQRNSDSVLYGLGKHGDLARAVFFEACLGIVGLWYVVPRFGLFAAASVVSALMIISRGLYVPYRVCRYLSLSYAGYLWGIFSRPVQIMTPIAAAIWMINRAIGSPATWPVVLGGGVIMAACYYPIALCALEKEHRRMILSFLGSVLGSRMHRVPRH